MSRLDSMLEREAKLEGRRHFSRCLVTRNCRYRNPYRIDTEEFNAFERGFFQAYKAHQGRMPEWLL